MSITLKNNIAKVRNEYDQSDKSNNSPRFDLKPTVCLFTYDFLHFHAYDPVLNNENAVDKCVTNLLNCRKIINLTGLKSIVPL